jgi:MOSC domain-containing protein YiiM
MPGGPHVVSVNVGAIREVSWRGRTVRTGIWKEPVAGPVAVGAEQVAGDQQADRRVHGGPDMAVYAYAAEDAAWWAEELGQPITPGTFGENLTVAGVDVSGAAVGDRWAIGDVVLEVTQPRLPCFKLGIRLGDQRVVRRFARAGRPGAYLRVIAPGTIAAGRPITVTPATGPVVRIVELAERDLSPDLAARILADPRVPPGWRRLAADAEAERSGA